MTPPAFLSAFGRLARCLLSGSGRAMLVTPALAALVPLAALTAHAQVLVVTSDQSLPENTVATYTQVTVQDGATWSVGGGSSITITGALTITGNSKVLAKGKNTASKVDNAWAGAGVTFHAGSVQIDAGSTLSADGQGYVGGLTTGTGPGANTATVNSYIEGASYGGLGNGTNPGTYGDSLTPLDLGSCSSAYFTAGLAGGGAIRLTVDGTLNLSGTISANGLLNGTPSYAAGGTGGSLWITTQTLTGAGSLSANASNAAPSGTTHGSGGGRIAVYFGDGAGFTGYATSTALGGLGDDGYRAEDGTVAFINTAVAGRKLEVYRRFALLEDTTPVFGDVVVHDGGELDLNGGATLSVTRLTALQGTGQLVMKSKNRTAKVGGNWSAVGSTLQTGDLTVTASAKLTSDGQGYATFQEGQGAGPGAPDGQWNGASHGGSGHSSAGVYDDPLQPSQPGSSTYTAGFGGPWSSTGGGGAMRIIVSNTFALDGALSARGLVIADNLGRQAGASGGAIWLTTGSLSGSGTISADAADGGAAANTGSGGGRIAIYSRDFSGFQNIATAITAKGGVTATAGRPTGQDGTIVLVDQSQSDEGDFRVLGRVDLPAQSQHTFHDVTIDNGAVLELGGGSTLTATNAFTVKGNSKVLVQGLNISAPVDGSWQGKGGTLNAKYLTVESGSSVTADGQGYSDPGGNWGVAAAGPGGGPQGVGASHGGLGGTHSNGTAAAAIYGDYLQPTTPGSSSTGSFYSNTAGGGVLRIVVSDTFKNDGVVSADGKVVYSTASSGATGGSIWVTAGTLRGAGTFHANALDSGYGAGSAGGRVAIYYNDGAAYEGFANAAATGGKGATANDRPGENGSVLFIDTSVANGGYFVPQRLVIPADTHAVYGGFTTGANALLEIGGGSSLTFDGALTLGANATLIAHGKNIGGKVAGVWAGEGVTLSAQNLIVPSGAHISADGQGYTDLTGSPGSSGIGPGASEWGVGASHGGQGGYNGGSVPAAVYDDYLAPNQPGSSSSGVGGTYSNVAGGGVLRINVSDTLLLDGTVTANGALLYANASSGASGGSIWVTTSKLRGAGTFHADAVDSGNGSGSGGGRLAVYYANGAGFSGFTGSTATRGMGANSNLAAGDNGTVAFIDTSADGGSLFVPQRLSIPADTNAVFGTLKTGDQAVIDVGGGSTLTLKGALVLGGHATLRAHGKNVTGRVGGVWAGEGVTIRAQNVTVPAGARFSADGEGYLTGDGFIGAGQGPGAGDNNQSNGAGHGGTGNFTGGVRGVAYDSALQPALPGSSSNGLAYTRTAGGGALRIDVGNTLTLDGVISADGKVIYGDNQAGASGGAIWVTTRNLAGGGRFSADACDSGVNASVDTGSSSGGRIAVYYANAASFRDFTLSTASAGKITRATTTGTRGQDGTVAFLDTSVPQFGLKVFQRFSLYPNEALHFGSARFSHRAELEMGGGSELQVDENLALTEGTNVVAHAANAYTPGQAAPSQYPGVTFRAGSMTLDALSGIDADGAGYSTLPGYGAAGGGPGAGSDHLTGASYGGRGSAAGSPATYGSLESPVDLGSSSGGFGYTTSLGGGAVRIAVKGAFKFDGLITADGVSPTTQGAHSGATGGSVWITAKTLSGNGIVTANAAAKGSAANTTDSGGGRIAVWAGSNSVPATNFTAAGGPAAEPGTVYFAAANQFLWIDPVVSNVQGSVPVSWFLIPSDPVHTVVDLTLKPSGTSQDLPLATGVVYDKPYTWDTNSLADGVYVLTGTARNTLTGSVLSTATRTLTVLNNVFLAGGIVSTDTTFPADRVIVVTSTLQIPSGVTLTLPPGAIVKFAAGTSIDVRSGGVLSALGDATHVISLTSLRDDSVGGDTNRDGTTTSPATGDWLGLRNSGGTLNLNAYTSVSYAPLQVTGTITDSQVWPAGSLFTVNGSLTIANGGSLTIQAGAIVKFARGQTITVNAGGSLTIDGTFARPVLLTSLQDDAHGGDTNGDGNATAAAPGDWAGLLFNGGVGHLNHAQLRYAGEIAVGLGGSDTTYGAIVSQGGTLNVANSSVTDSSYDAFIGAGSSTVELTNCVMARNQIGVHSIGTSSTFVLKNCVLDDNSVGVDYVLGGRIDVYDTSITNQRKVGVQTRDYALPLVFKNNNVWNVLAGTSDATGARAADVAAGQNGNISANPLFRNRGADDYRLSGSSPLVNAADPVTSAATDARGFARVGPPDIGAFEYTSGASSTLDLTVASIAGPIVGISGDRVELGVILKTLGGATVAGPWSTAISLRPEDGSADLSVGVITNGPVGNLEPGATASLRRFVELPPGLVGTYRWVVTTNADEAIDEGANLENNTLVSASTIAIDVPELTFGTDVVGNFTSTGQFAVYKFRPTALGTAVLLKASRSGDGGWTKVYFARGRVPTAQDFDDQSPQWNSPKASVLIANTADDWYYVRVQATDLPVPAATFTLGARVVDFGVTGINLDKVSNKGPATLQISGTDLTGSVQVFLRRVGGDGTLLPATLNLNGGTAANAKFDFNGVQAGDYRVVVVKNGVEQVLDHPLTVSADAVGAKLITAVSGGPAEGRVGFPYNASVVVLNKGSNDSLTPIVVLSGPGIPSDPNDASQRAIPFPGYGVTNLKNSPLDQFKSQKGRNMFFALPASGDPTVFAPNAVSNRFPAQGRFVLGRFKVESSLVFANNTDSFDLTGLGNQLTPLPKPAGWDDAWNLLIAGYPQTQGGLVRLTNTAAKYLWDTEGFRSDNISEILSKYSFDFYLITSGNVKGQLQWANPLEASQSSVSLSLLDASGTVVAGTQVLADGSFGFDGVPAGTYSVRVAGAVPTATIAPIVVTTGSSTSGIVIPVRTGASLHVTLAGSLVGGTLSDCRITLSDVHGPSLFDGEADSVGNVTLRGIPGGTYRLKAYGPGVPALHTTSIEIPDTGAYDAGTLTFTLGGTLSGSVTRAGSSVPLAGVSVSLLGEDGISTVTAADGTYTLGAVPAGDYTLVARLSGYATVLRTNTTVSLGTSSPVDVGMEAGAGLTGSVSGAFGPLARATVDVLVGSTVVAETYTAADGTYVFTDLPPGVVTIRVDHPLYGTSNQPSVLTSNSSIAAGNLALSIQPYVSGSVKTTTGKALPGVMILLVQPDGSRLATSTQSDGSYAFAQVPAGTSTVSLLDGSHARSVTLSGSSGSSALADFTLDMGNLVGRCVAEDGTTPILAKCALLKDGVVVSTVRVLSDGTFTLRDIEAGDYTLTAWSAALDYSPLAVTISAGTTRDLGALTPAVGSLKLSISSQPSTVGRPDSEGLLQLTRRLSDDRDFGHRIISFPLSAGLTVSHLAAGRYWARVDTGFFSSGWIPVDIAQTEVSLPLALRDAGLVSGTVTGLASAPFEGANVSLVDTADRTRIYTTNTTLAGSYVNRVPAGTYDVYVGSPLQTVSLSTGAQGTVTVGALDVIDKTVALPAATATLSGRVLASDGISIPVSGDVSLITDDGVTVCANTLNTDGTYSLPLPAAGHYRLRVLAIDYVFPLQGIDVSTTDLANVNLTGTWRGGSNVAPPDFSDTPLQLASSALVSATPALRAGAKGVKIQDGPKALGINLQGFWDTYEAFRTWFAENVTGRPPPSQPSLPRAPAGLYDPNCPCPQALAHYKGALNLQMMAEREHGNWVKTWDDQVTQLSDKIRDFGVNLGKVALALYTAGRSQDAEAALNGMNRNANSLRLASDYYDKLAKEYQVLKASGLATTENLQRAGKSLWVMERALKDGEVFRQKYAQLQVILAKFGLGATAAGGLAQFTGSDPLGGNPLSGIVKDINELPGILKNIASDPERLKTVIDNIAGNLQLYEQLMTLTKDPAFKGSPALAAYSKYSDILNAISSTQKAILGILEYMDTLEKAKADYFNMLEKRDREYQLCLQALRACRANCDRGSPELNIPELHGSKMAYLWLLGKNAEDPNAKLASGYGLNAVVRTDEPITYTITFENKAAASAPAQHVLVTDQLSNDLDWSTFELVAVGFNHVMLQMPSGLQRYQAKASVTTDPNPVLATLNLNPHTGLFTTDLRSVDGTTGGYPADSLAGFLPPNDANNSGDGFVTFRIRPKANLADGTVIQNTASIVFDRNEPIVTNTTLSPVDALAPTATVLGLPATSGSGISVSWAGVSNAGIASYTIYVSKDGGAWTEWLSNTEATSGVYNADSGGTYRFFAFAVDVAGLTSSTNVSSQANTMVGLPAHLINLSTRGLAQTGDGQLIPGFVLTGAGTKPLLVRSVGPTLGTPPFNVPGVLADPVIQFHQAATLLFENNDWGTAPDASTVASVAAASGAFPLPTLSKDAAAVATLAAGTYTANTYGYDGGSGVALVEVYDADKNNASEQLINVSTRGYVGTDSNAMIGGFVIEGNGTLRVLVRGVGPGLEPFHVAGTLANPRLSLYNGSTLVASNDDWDTPSDGDAVAAAAAASGAFGLSRGSLDSSLLLDLPAGQYTAILEGTSGGTGIAIIEVYAVPVSPR